MSNDQKAELYESIQLDDSIIKNQDVAHLTIHQNKVVSSHSLPGLHIETKEITNGVEVNIKTDPGTKILKPIHLCFGVIPKEGEQNIITNTHLGEDSSITVMSHCTFPNAVNVIHNMKASIELDKNSSYRYLEKHVHSQTGGIKVIPVTKVLLHEGAKFISLFELLKGRVGLIDLDYNVDCEKDSVLEMDARINGTGDDIIKIKETGNLIGENSRGVLKSRIAVRDNSKAEIYSKLTASAAYAQGHVDCQEIIQDDAIAEAIPIVTVSNPKANITHEAAIGSVDNKQLETLMTRGLTEEEAVELIIQGLLS